MCIFFCVELTLKTKVNYLQIITLEFSKIIIKVNNKKILRQKVFKTFNQFYLLKKGRKFFVKFDGKLSGHPLTSFRSNPGNSLINQ